MRAFWHAMIDFVNHEVEMCQNKSFVFPMPRATHNPPSAPCPLFILVLCICVCWAKMKDKEMMTMGWTWPRGSKGKIYTHREGAWHWKNQWEISIDLGRFRTSWGWKIDFGHHNAIMMLTLPQLAQTGAPHVHTAQAECCPLLVTNVPSNIHIHILQRMRLSWQVLGLASMDWESDNTLHGISKNRNPPHIFCFWQVLMCPVDHSCHGAILACHTTLIMGVKQLTSGINTGLGANIFKPSCLRLSSTLRAPYVILTYSLVDQTGRGKFRGDC